MASNRIRFRSDLVRGAAACAIALSGAFILLYMLLEEGNYAFMAIGLLCTAAILIPLILRDQFDPFEPIVLIAFSVFMGCTLRPIMLAVAGDENRRVWVLTNGVPLEELAAHTFWVPLSLAIFSFGYMAARRRFAIERLPGLRNDNWSEQRLWCSIVFMALLSAYATWRLAVQTGVDLTDLSKVSRKRAVEVTTSDGEIVYAAQGYWVLMSTLSKVALLLLIVHCLRQPRAVSVRSFVRRMGRSPMLILLFALAVLWPILSSSRNGLLEIIFAIGVVVAYLGFNGSMRARKRMFKGIAAVGIITALAILAGVGVWRQHSQTGVVQDTTVIEAVLNNSVGSGNFLSLERTGIIVRETPGGDDLMLGQSYLTLITAPIPRTWWPEKPPLSLGPYIRTEIYGRTATTNGATPGFLGEAYLNFSYFGVLVVPFLAGVCIRYFYNSFRPLLGRHRGITVLYSLALWPVGFGFPELNLSMALIGILMAAVPGYLALMFVSRNAPRVARWSDVRLKRRFESQRISVGH